MTPCQLFDGDFPRGPQQRGQHSPGQNLEARPVIVIPDRINGLDLCSLQWPVDYQKVKDAGFSFAYIKSSQYSRIMDYRFSAHMAGFKSVGMAVAPYHFCSHDTDPEEQAEFFYRASGGLGSKPGELPPMMDWEFCTPSKYPDHPQHCVTWIERFAARVTKLWYPDNSDLLLAGFPARLPVLYTYPFYAAGHQPQLGGSGLAKYPLCYASYSTGTALQPDRIPDHKLPSPWTTWTICQHKGNDGRVPGVKGACDMQVFNGNSADWAAFRGINRPHKEEPHPAAVSEASRSLNK